MDLISSEYKKAQVSLLLGHIIGNAYMIPLSYLMPSIMVKEDIVAYIKYSVIDGFDSDLQIMNQFGVFELQRFLEIDAMYRDKNVMIYDKKLFHILNEHKIISDSLTYTKNAAVLRMFESMIKTERFHHSLKEFFIINKYVRVYIHNIYYIIIITVCTLSVVIFEIILPHSNVHHYIDISCTNEKCVMCYVD